MSVRIFVFQLGSDREQQQRQQQGELRVLECKGPVILVSSLFKGLVRYETRWSFGAFDVLHHGTTLECSMRKVSHWAVNVILSTFSEVQLQLFSIILQTTHA